jgi:hypothetical protein
MKVNKARNRNANRESYIETEGPESAIHIMIVCH